MRRIYLSLLCISVYTVSIFIPHSNNAFFYAEKINESFLIIFFAWIISCRDVVRLPIVSIKIYVTSAIITSELAAIALNLFAFLEYWSDKKIFFYVFYGMIQDGIVVFQIIVLLSGKKLDAVINRFPPLRTIFRS